jgi:hypothetical protein
MGRRTLLLAGAILASAALFIMPNSPTLWFAAGMLWIMDAHQRFYGTISCFCWRYNLPENNVPWDLPCKVFFY